LIATIIVFTEWDGDMQLASIQINQYKCFAYAGLKKPMDFIRAETEKVRRHVFEYIGRTASDGDRLAAIEKGGNPIADIAMEHAWLYEYPEDTTPRPFGPEISVKLRSNSIDIRT
jgi:hypothetical protein